MTSYVSVSSPHFCSCGSFPGVLGPAYKPTISTTIQLFCLALNQKFSIISYIFYFLSIQGWDLQENFFSFWDFCVSVSQKHPGRKTLRPTPPVCKNQNKAKEKYLKMHFHSFYFGFLKISVETSPNNISMGGH